MKTTLCAKCRNMREVRTARSPFLRCELSITNAAYAKSPRQPLVKCDGYREKGDNQCGQPSVGLLFVAVLPCPQIIANWGGGHPRRRDRFAHVRALG